jgi:AcrR family transcriptional regulator
VGTSTDSTASQNSKPGSHPRRRLTSAQRYEQVVAAAVLAFAASGYAGTTTDDVARRVGVSQPYIIRLFGTKQALFLAAVDRACTQIEETFRDTAGRSADLRSLGRAFKTLLGQRELLLVLLHGFAASGDPAVGPVVRRRYGDMYRLVRELTGADAAQAREFLSTGMLLTVLSAMDVVAPDHSGREPWADELLKSLPESSAPRSPGGDPVAHKQPRQR